MGDRIAVLAGGRLQQVGTPAQVYDEPVNRFVARFLGSPPMNLVPGGGVLGGEPDIVVGVRPEDVLIAADGSAVSGFPAEVALVESLGSETVLSVRCEDGTRLDVRTGPRSPYRQKATIALSVDPDRRHLFDRASGRRR